MNEKIDAKIKQIEEDIKAIANNEMLGVYKGQPHPKEEEIKFQQWRIDVLRYIKTLSKTDAANELIRLKDQYKKYKKYETLVIVDLYAYALGVK